MRSRGRKGEKGGEEEVSLASFLVWQPYIPLARSRWLLVSGGRRCPPHSTLCHLAERALLIVLLA